MSVTYFRLTGLAYQKGIDSFEEIMPESRVSSLYQACLKTKPFSWFENDKFIKWILSTAGREERLLKRPACSKDCKYRMKYCSLDPQRNALRVEIFTPQDRCGWDLIDGRRGGCPQDDHRCNFIG